MLVGRPRSDLAPGAQVYTGALSLIFAPLSTPYIPYPFLILWLIWLIGRMIIAIYSRHPHPEKEFSVDMAAQL